MRILDDCHRNSQYIEAVCHGRICAIAGYDREAAWKRSSCIEKNKKRVRYLPGVVFSDSEACEAQ